MSDEREALYLVSYFLLINFFALFFSTRLKNILRWNQLDLAIVALSIMGIVLEELKMKGTLPINPTIIRIMRVLRIARGTHTLTNLSLLMLYTLTSFHSVKLS